MSTIKIGSSNLKKGVTVNPLTVLFNGNNVKKIVNKQDNKTLWGKGFIYDHGDEYKYITGGWAGGTADSNYTKTGTLTKNTDHMLVKNVSSGSYSAITMQAINLTEYSQLVLTMKSSGGIAILINSAFPSKTFTLKQVINPSKNEYENYIIDISNISGTYAIAICDSNATGNLCIQTVMLLK